MIEQTWFSGVHSDVGGWYRERGLSNIALRLMLEKARSSSLDIDDAMASTMKSNPNDKINEPYSGFWKFWSSRRRITSEGTLIHKSVFDRIHNPENKYKPKNLPKNYTVVE